MKTYSFELIIREGNDEFWESLEGKSGCDEISDLLRSMLWEFGFNESNSKLSLVKFEVEE